MYLQAAGSGELFEAGPALVNFTFGVYILLMKQISVLCSFTSVSILRPHLLFIRIGLLFSYRCSFGSGSAHTDVDVGIEWVYVNTLRREDNVTVPFTTHCLSKDDRIQHQIGFTRNVSVSH
jgi:hypothetical protein